MPIYEYRCEGCGEEYEERRSFSAMDEARACPLCGADSTERKVSMSFAVVGAGAASGGDFDFGDEMDHSHGMGDDDDFDFDDF